MITEIGTSIDLAARWLRNGQLVAIPTETVYGLAANALDQDAVLKIFSAKERPRFNPLIIHVASINQVAQYANHIPSEALLLMEAFAPGPITFLLPKKDIIPDMVTAGSSKIAIRIPAHPLTHLLLDQLNFPLAAPSANRFGHVSPVTADHVRHELAGRIPYILDGGPCAVGLESTIVDFEGGHIIIRRTGGISVEQIEATLGFKVTLMTKATEHPVAPGQLISHYATTTPLFMGHLENLCSLHHQKKVVLVGWGKQQDIKAESGLWFETNIPLHVFSLSEKKSLDEAAKNLFAIMRQADQLGADVILVSSFPNKGIGMAINDRLQRAQHHLKPDQEA